MQKSRKQLVDELMKFDKYSETQAVSWTGRVDTTAYHDQKFVVKSGKSEKQIELRYCAVKQDPGETLYWQNLLAATKSVYSSFPISIITFIINQLYSHLLHVLLYPSFCYLTSKRLR